MKLDKDEVISAQVVLRSASGHDIGPDTLITSENIELFSPPPEAYPVASKVFSAMGFDIGPMVGVGFSITAPVRIFESTFKSNLHRNVEDVIEIATGGLEFPLDHLPKSVHKIILTVTLSEPPDFGPTNF